MEGRKIQWQLPTEEITAFKIFYFPVIFLSFYLLLVRRDENYKKTTQWLKFKSLKFIVYLLNIFYAIPYVNVFSTTIE